ncbi:MAG TPA: undecaprenyl-diphosphate phosphatase [Gemmatimonadota bacterium]|jgi:undecaprenyl-diphosphatase
MTVVDAVLLGLVQGLTEFLPVSSSAHLVMGEELLGLNEPGVAFDVFVHGATLLAVLIYFRRRIVELVRRGSWSYAGKILVGTIPAGLAGVLFETQLESTFADLGLLVVTLVVTGALLLSLDAIPADRPETVEPSWWHAWWMGCAQMVSILPGISRSGATIVTGRWLGLAPAAAAEFSFLLSVPAIAGAVVLQAGEIQRTGVGDGAAYLAAWIAAFGSGIAAIMLVFRTLAGRRFSLFGWYCLAAAAAFGAWVWLGA